MTVLRAVEENQQRQRQMQGRGCGGYRGWWKSGFLRCGGKCAAFGRNDGGLVGVEKRGNNRTFASGWRPWRRGREVRSRGRLRGSSRLRSRWLSGRRGGGSRG